MHLVTRLIMMKSQLAELLRRIRKSRGNGQRAIAKSVGIPASNWARFETGERWPTLNVINNLKRILNIPSGAALSDEDHQIENDTESLSPGDQSYLMHKWLFELYELRRKIARKKKYLQQAKDRRVVQAEELHAIDIQLNPAQDILKELQDKGSPNDIIAIQQAVVDSLLKKRERAETSPAFLSNIELRVLKGGIELLEFKQEWLEKSAKEMDYLGEGI